MISVIVPTWNEEEHLAATLSAIENSKAPREVFVVDAASSDHTLEIARRFGATVLLSPARQRAAQLNFGAANSTGEIILFLHADTIVPPEALDLVQNAFADQSIVGGAFQRRFQSASVFLRCTCALAAFRNRVIGWHLGDQAMFARRSEFEKLGGFPPMDRFEDLEFSRRLGRKGRVVTLRPPVISSSRRFESEGPFVRTMRDFLLTMQYLRRNF
mgnify:CR=1 FL=1